MKTRKSVVLSFVATLVLSVALGFSFGGSARPAYSQSTPVTDPQTEILQRVYAKVNPSVVTIDVRIPATGATTLPVNPQQPNPRRTQPQNPNYDYAAGSGWVYDSNGHLVTNAHVVTGADQITLTFSDGTQFRAKVVGIDPDSDLAVIQAQGDISKYAPLTLADSDKVQVGERAIAIGNPFQNAGTLTHGIVSAVGRSVQGNAANYVIPNAIQTDAAINPGNSGGPLLNANGELIGVNQQIAAEVRQSSGVSFAIPSNLVKIVAEALIKDGKMAHSYLGVSGGTVTLDLIEAVKLPAGTHGAYVNSVVANGPAAKSGLRAGSQTAEVNGAQYSLGGDVITAVDGNPVRSFDDLTGYLFLKTAPGQQITLTVLRDGSSVDVKVTLGARPSTTTTQ